MNYDGWEEAVVVRASHLVKTFPLVKIYNDLWIAGMPSDEGQWSGRVLRIEDIPGNARLYHVATGHSMNRRLND